MWSRLLRCEDMNFLYSSLLLLCLVSQGHGMLFGRGTFLVSSPSDFLCKTFAFNPAFLSSSVRVQLALHMNEVTGATYEAAVSWVEQVSAGGFTACVAASGPIAGNRTVSLQWLAYRNAPGGLTGIESLTIWTTGTKCVDIDFVSAGKTFSKQPYVFVTSLHGVSRNKHDAASVWAEDVTRYGFKICLRELKSFDGEHKSITADWLALESIPAGWEVPYESVVTLPNTLKLDSTQHYSFCKKVNFTNPFYSKPVMITTARHYCDKTNPKTIYPDRNAITEWIEDVTLNDFRVCMKDIQPYAGHHDPVTISYMAIGYLNPCLNVRCTHYATCNAFGPKDARCVCVKSCPDFEDLLCGSDGKTYKNLCTYQKYICETHLNITSVHLGACYPFILHRGRVLLDLSTTDVKCQVVTYSTKNFMVGGAVHVQASINYYSSPDHSFVHDAAVAWTEQITTNNFTLCALKAGRNDRKTPDSGRTFVDYIAYQGAPVGAVAGEITLANWWQGTTCKVVSLPSGKFSSTPYALVTSEHMVVGQKHDAATIWIENPTSSSIKVCLRELQNFDGLHKDIHVNWIAYDTLPVNMKAERVIITFANSLLPKVQDNFAYCQNLGFSGNYTTTPTMLVTAVHSTVLGKLIPEYNSISVWIEFITVNSFRVCIKELHTPNGYDPVVVSALALGS